MFVIIDSKGQYITIDHRSGGYPGETSSISSATIWHSVNDAIHYYSHFKQKQWKLHALDVKTESIPWE